MVFFEAFNADQGIIFAVLTISLVLFVKGRWRFDIVALIGLFSLTLIGIIPASEAFSGLGHPAVITVGSILILSKGLSNSGLVDFIAKVLLRIGKNNTAKRFSINSLSASFSAFMNNIGSLALFMPVAIKAAKKSGHPPSMYLMPLAFSTLLGGMITLIGTPPNIIIATFRASESSQPFGMFDFAPVGLGVAIVGVFFISAIGWRLIPIRKSKEDNFGMDQYMSEVSIGKESKVAGKTIHDLEKASGEDITILALLRGDERYVAPSAFTVLREGDILVVESEPSILKSLVDDIGLEIVGGGNINPEVLKSEESDIAEVVIIPDSPLVGNTALSLGLHWKYGINIIAVGRHGERIHERLGRIVFEAGDVLILHGNNDSISESIQLLGCLPLAERNITIGKQKHMALSFLIFASALALSAINILEIQVAFSVGAVLMVLFGIISADDAYKSIDWPVIILLAALIPVGVAFETTGAAALIASFLLDIVPSFSAPIVLTLLLVTTMLISDVLNNAATAILMAPIAINVANGIGASIDPFLMAVAVGASCAFLTPIGHQSNTLVMGPGGYRFGDYWKLGIVLEAVIVAVSIPLILHFWPL